MRGCGCRPANIEALGLKAVALEELGDREGARHLVDFERFVQVLDFAAPPEGYDDMAAFNAALARHALEHPTLSVPPEADPRYHCATLRITEEFLAEPKGPASVFERMIETAVDGYIRGFARRDPSHPFLVSPPRRWQLTSWAAVLDGEGNLNPHVHYAGYISGVYYPPDSRADRRARPGRGRLVRARRQSRALSLQDGAADARHPAA